MKKFDFKNVIYDFIKVENTSVSNTTEDRFKAVDEQIKLIKRKQKQFERLRWRNFKW